jgi:putative transposase
VHVLIDTHPALDISGLINNLETASARRARSRFADHPAPCRCKPLFWSRAEFIGSIGGVTLKPVRACVNSQDTTEHASSRAQRQKHSPLTPFSPVGFAFGFARRSGRLRRGDSAGNSSIERGWRLASSNSW